jgi:RNA polymerase sigma-70 factor, ECF subfamily
MDMSRGKIDRLIADRGLHDPAVMEAVVGEYGLPIFRLALSILLDPADAQDVAQETFINAAAALTRYQPGTNFKAWLMKIAVNHCRMVLRKRTARRSLLQAWESINRLGSQPPAIEAQVIQDETRDELWKMVDGLDEKHRLVVVLRLVLAMPISEISQVLGIHEKTVYSRLYDALARLRVQMRMRPEFTHYWDEVQS